MEELTNTTPPPAVNNSEAITATQSSLTQSSTPPATIPTESEADEELAPELIAQAKLEAAEAELRAWEKARKQQAERRAQEEAAAARAREQQQTQRLEALIQTGLLEAMVSWEEATLEAEAAWFRRLVDELLREEVQARAEVQCGEFKARLIWQPMIPRLLADLRRRYGEWQDAKDRLTVEWLRAWQIAGPGIPAMIEAMDSVVFAERPRRREPDFFADAPSPKRPYSTSGNGLHTHQPTDSSTPTHADPPGEAPRVPGPEEQSH